MRSIKVFWGPLVFLLLVANQLSHYGRRWEFGRYGMPHALSEPGGYAYADGTPIDPFTRGLIRSGIEEDFMLTICLFITGCAIWTLLLLRDTASKRQQIEQCKQMLRELRQSQR